MPSSPNSLPKKRKIAVMGSRSVGKSSLVIQFVESHFAQAYYPTIESKFRKTISYNGTEFDCEIIDTAGQDEHSILDPKHVIGIHGYVLVYSVTSRNSFNMVQNLYNKIIDFCGMQSIPCVIVGSKTDLQTSPQIQPSEGKKLAEENYAAWVETSAKNNTNVSLVFELCLGEIERHLRRNIASPSPPPAAPLAEGKNSCCIM